MDFDFHLVAVEDRGAVLPFRQAAAVESLNPSVGHRGDLNKAPKSEERVAKLEAHPDRARNPDDLTKNVGSFTVQVGIYAGVHPIVVDVKGHRCELVAALIRTCDRGLSRHRCLEIFGADRCTRERQQANENRGNVSCFHHELRLTAA